MVILLLLQQQRNRRRPGLIDLSFWLVFNCSINLPVYVFLFSVGKLLKKVKLSIVAASLLATLTFGRGDKEDEPRKGNHNLFFDNA